jgi:ankyrin repeat protein
MFKKNNALKMDLINSKSMHQTPLIIASHAKQLKTVEYLLSRDGILVNDRVHDGWNALMVACEVGSTSIVSALMKHPKIEVRIMRNNGYSALHQACLGGHNEIVQLLLPAMTTSFINLEGKDNQTPLSLAVWNNHSDVVNVR